MFRNETPQPATTGSAPRDLRSRIVTAARQLCFADGVEALSARRLAAEVGCSPGALYLHFRNLEEILHELYQCEERLFAWGSRAIGLLRKAGGEGLTTTIGWPQEVSQRWSDKIWPLSHKLVAQAAGLGVIGTSRNFLHRKFGAYCLIDTIVTNLEFEAADYAAAAPIDWNPCLACNLCVASCPAEIHEAFHAGKEERIRYKEEHVRPLTHTRRHVEEQLVIDSPSVRDELGIAPGDWRTPPDPSRPGQQGTRLVQLQRIRVSNVDSMMRMMPMYFRYKEAEGLDITFQFDLSGEGGGRWTLRVADRRCEVRPGVAEDADLRICCDGTVLLGIHRGERNAVIDLLLGRIRLQGRKELFLLMPRLFPVNAPEGRLARWSWMLRRALRRYRSAA
jgi:AcrR family transcriptional regulator/putative sterol carrier protein